MNGSDAGIVKRNRTFDAIREIAKPTD